jgi:hypothetical protein
MNSVKLQWGAHLLGIWGTLIFKIQYKFKCQVIVSMNKYNRLPLKQGSFISITRIRAPFHSLWRAWFLRIFARSKADTSK